MPIPFLKGALSSHHSAQSIWEIMEVVFHHGTRFLDSRFPRLRISICLPEARHRFPGWMPEQGLWFRSHMGLRLMEQPGWIPPGQSLPQQGFPPNPFNSEPRMLTRREGLSSTFAEVGIYLPANGSPEWVEQ